MLDSRIQQVFFVRQLQDSQNIKYHRTPTKSLAYCASHDSIQLASDFHPDLELSPQLLAQLTDSHPLHMELIDSSINAHTRTAQFDNTFICYAPTSPDFHQLLPNVLRNRSKAWKLVAFEVFSSSPPILYYLDTAHPDCLESVEVNPKVNSASLYIECDDDIQFFLEYDNPNTKLLRCANGQKTSYFTYRRMNPYHEAWREVPYIPHT